MVAASQRSHLCGFPQIKAHGNCSHTLSGGRQERKQDGRGVTTASIFHPSAWNNEKAWQTNKPHASWAVRVRLPCWAQFCAGACTAICSTPPCQVLLLLLLCHLLCCAPFGSARLGTAQGSSDGLARLGWARVSLASPSACSSLGAGTVNLKLCCFPLQHHSQLPGAGESTRGTGGAGRGQSQRAWL